MPLSLGWKIIQATSLSYGLLLDPEEGANTLLYLITRRHMPDDRVNV
jgi:hypothetical protein